MEWVRLGRRGTCDANPHQTLSLVHSENPNHCHCLRSPRLPNPPDLDHPGPVPNCLTRPYRWHLRNPRLAQDLEIDRFPPLLPPREYYYFRKWPWMRMHTDARRLL